MDKKIIQEITNVLKNYFNDLLRATYKIRFDEYSKTITLDEYYNKMINNNVTTEDGYKVKLTKEDTDKIFIYVLKYLGCVSLNKKIGFIDYLIEIFGCANFYSTEFTDNKDEIIKYLELIISLKDSLVEHKIEGRVSLGNDKIDVYDYLNNLFIKYDKNESKMITDPMPVLTIDKLFVKENNDIIADCGLHYYNYRLDCRYSKKLEYPPCKFTSLKTYLDDLGANFLMKNYYDESEIKVMPSLIENFMEFKNNNLEYSRKCALEYFLQVLESGYQYTHEQCDKFIDILSKEILQQLFLDNNALIHNLYPDSLVFDEAVSQSNIQKNNYALALSVTSDSFSVAKGYKALKIIYNINSNK